MNYSELFLDTLDYSQELNSQNEELLKFRVRLVGPGVEAPGVLNLTQMDRLLENWDSRELTWDEVMEVGEYLGNALFQGEVRSALLRDLPEPGTEKGLRIRLFLNYPLTNYPFEYALVNDTGGETTANHFLALLPEISIVRQQCNLAPAGSLSQAKHPLKLVAALASPPGVLPVLDLTREKTAIQNALNAHPGKVQPIFFENATRTELGSALEEAPIFHYAGHAVMEKKGSRVFGLLEGHSRLKLQDGDLEAETLGVMLRKAHTSIAMLGGCETARRDDLNVWSSMAAHLLNAGLFAVIAMQYRIGNESAISFASEFYRALLAGLSLDEAVSNGRMAIAAKGNRRDWAVPVLYLAGTSDGIVFEELKNDLSLQALREEIHKELGQVAQSVTGMLVNVKKMTVSAGGIGVLKMEGGQIFPNAQNVTVVNNLSLPENEAQKRFALINRWMGTGLESDKLEDDMKQIRKYHIVLKEWKELHNDLDATLSAFFSYYDFIQGLLRKGKIDNFDMEEISRRWGPVSCKVDDLIRFAEGIKSIGTPFNDDAGRLTGEDWAIEIYNLRKDIKDKIEASLTPLAPRYILRGKQRIGLTDSPELLTLITLTSNLKDKVLSHMSWADSHLRETAGELSSLSDKVFGSLKL